MDVAECWSRTGKAPVTVKWVDTDKGENGEVRVRSRFVARDFHAKGNEDREDLFPATPPVDAKKVLFSVFASMPEMRLAFIDAARAYLHAKARRRQRRSAGLLPRGG